MKNQLYKSILITGSLIININLATAQTIAGGSDHSLFLCDNGIPKSCGWNDKGQLGDGSTVDKSTAVNTGTLTGIISVEGGYQHSLFLKGDGTVWSSGYNIGGQLGDGTTINKSNPVQVSGLTGITAISAGRNQSLFLKNDGTVWACGYNGYGELGDGTTTLRSTPVQINSLTGIIAIAAGGMPTVGDFSIFLKNDGTVWATGYNGYGALGDGTIIERHSPVQVINLNNIIAIAAGANHSIFLKNDGTVWACGYNASGQVGNGTTTLVTSAVQVSSVTNIVGIAAGYYHSLFLKNDGTVWSCGSNFAGQLGNGTTTPTSTPVQASSLNAIQAMAGGQYHSLFLKTDGTVWACGQDSKGQMGIGIDANPHPVAVQVSSLCTVATELKENSIENNISVYPNPGNGEFKIQIDSEIKNGEIILINSLGQKVYEQKIIQGSNEINTNELPNGLYNCILLRDKQHISNSNLIIE